MTVQECIKQLESLRAHCDAMFDDKFANDDPWDADCMALDMAIVALENGIKALKAANVPVGHWMWASDGDGYVCPVCGTDYCIMVGNAEKYKYCPECGKRLYPPIGEAHNEEG